MSKFLGFLLGVAVALAGPAVFGVLAAPGGIELNAKEMALAFGIGALIFWAVVSYFSGAAALGAFAAFGTLIYCWHWIPNRTTNFLNDVPGVTTGMIEGSKQYTLNGVVPILTVISLVYAIQLIVRSVQRRRRERAEAERLQREQEAAQAQQEADAAAVYPVAGSTYPPEGGGYGGSYGNSNRFGDLFDEDPEPIRPRNQADEHTAQFPASAPEQTAQYPGVDAPDNDARGNESGDDTVLVPTDRDETTQVPADRDETRQVPVEGGEPGQAQAGESTPPQPQEQPAAEVQEQPTVGADEQPPVTAPVETDEQPTAVAPAEAEGQKPEQSGDPQKKNADNAQQAVAAPVTETKQGAPAAEAEQAAPAPVVEAKQGTPAAEPKQASAAEATQGAPGVESKQGLPGSEGKAPVAQEQVGQQYRERMEDPEDTGEFYISAFENPTQMSIRPAGA